MRDDLPEPAVRLLASLPVTEHRQREPDQRKVKRLSIFPPQKGPPGSPVRIAGVDYPSIKAARRKLKKGTKEIKRMLSTGAAEYL